MKKIELNKDNFALVDDEDFEYLNQWKWSFDGRYASRIGLSADTKKIYMQRLVNNTPKGFDTDHANGDKLDNRKENLRSVTRSQNNANQKKTRGFSKYKGVSWHKQRSKWKAEIKINGKRKHLGVFIIEEEAAEAYNKAALVAFGSFSKQNSI